jgi:uncharacterized membrane protein YeiH
MAFCVVGYMVVLNAGTNCRMTIWTGVCMGSFGQLCKHIILLQKVYLVLYRQKWVLIVGGILVLPQLSHSFFIFKGFNTVIVDDFCGMYYPSFVPFYWFGAVGSVNLLFSAIFC